MPRDPVVRRSAVAACAIAVVVALATSSSAQASTQDPRFSPYVEYSTHQPAFGLALADVGTDAHPSVVSASRSALAVLRHDAARPGSLQPPVQIDGLSDMEWLATGDVNGDGIPDLVVPEWAVQTGPYAYAGGVAVLLGDTSSSTGFDAPVEYLADAGTTDAAVGDVTGDGVPDIVTTNDAGSVSVLPGDGANPGHFLARTDIPLGDQYGDSRIRLADLNGDGRLDIVVTEDRPNLVSVLLADPSATDGFAQTSYPVAGGPIGLAVADLNGDRRPDIVTTDSAANTVSVLLADPTRPGDFDQPADYSTGTTPVDVGVADVTGDGVPDIVTSDYGSDAVSVLAGDPRSPGSLLPRTDLPTPAEPAQLALGDLNGDGLADIAVSSFGSDSVAVLLQRPHVVPATCPRGNSAGVVCTRVDGVLHLQGTAGPDTLVGGPGDDVLNAGAGNDVVRGRGGSDTISGGPGNDHLYARDGVADHISGGPGTDTAVIDQSDSVTSVEHTRLPTPWGAGLSHPGVARR